MNRKFMALSLSAVIVIAMTGLTSITQFSSVSAAVDTNRIKFQKKNFSDPLNINN